MKAKTVYSLEFYKRCIPCFSVERTRTRSMCFFAVFMLIYASVSAQPDSIHLANCLQLLSERSPVNQRKLISGEIGNMRVANYTTGWYPDVTLSAQANYNSETMDVGGLLEEIPVTISLPEIPLDQYKVWADINQVLYDGGLTNARKKAEKTAVALDIQQSEIDLYQLKQTLIQVYFSLLLADRNREVLKISLDELKTNIKVMQAAVDHGIILPEELLSMEAEALRMGQMIDEVDFSRQTMVNTLSILIDSTLQPEIALCIPSEPESLLSEPERPEVLLFDRQKQSIDANKKLIATSNLPKIFAFSQLAYGRPGYNMISSDFHTYYSVGLGMKWDFLNYGESRRERRILDLQKDLIDLQVESFDDQLNIELTKGKNDIHKYDEFLNKDEQIVKLRKEITSASFSKLNNGVISSSEYLSAFNKEMLAELQLENHTLQRLQAIYNYLFAKGAL